MGLIIEPKGVDFIVGPSVLTDKDRTTISEIIANYKKTGKLPLKRENPTARKRKNTANNKLVSNP